MLRASATGSAESAVQPRVLKPKPLPKSMKFLSVQKVIAKRTEAFPKHRKAFPKQPKSYHISFISVRCENSFRPPCTVRKAHSPRHRSYQIAPKSMKFRSVPKVIPKHPKKYSKRAIAPNMVPNGSHNVSDFNRNHNDFL